MPDENEIRQKVAEDLGIADMSIAEQKELISQFGEVALKAATVAVVGTMSEEQRAQFAVLAQAGDAQAVQAFLDETVPGHEAIASAAVVEEVKNFRASQTA